MSRWLASVVPWSGLAVLLMGQASVSLPILWLTWDLQLGTHTPPQAFRIVVTSSDMVPMPPPLTVSYTLCAQPEALKVGAFCLAVGCPPRGRYTFLVQADYGEEGLSQAGTVQCVLTRDAACRCGSPLSPPTPVPPPPPVPPPVARPPIPSDPSTAWKPVDTTQLPPLVETIDEQHLSTEVPPLTEVPAEDASLQPLGAMPAMPTAPGIPAPWKAQRAR